MRGYVSLGSAEDVVSAALARALVDVLPTSEETAKRIESVKDKVTEEITERGLLDELAAAGCKVARSTLDTELGRWLTAGHAGKTGAGKKGSPARFWMIATPPETFFRSYTPRPSEESIAADPPQATGSDAPAASDAEPIVSSNASDPSEECMRPQESEAAPESMLSSDAPHGCIGRKHFSPSPAPGEQDSASPSDDTIHIIDADFTDLLRRTGPAPKPNGHASRSDWSQATTVVLG